MLKIGFWFDAPAEYSGGINYVKNILYALSKVNDGVIEPYVFFSADIPKHIESQFSPYATIVRTKILQRGTPLWFLHQFFYRLIGSMALVNAVLKSHEIDVLSHVWFVYKGKAPFQIIGWIPDFQYLHLPELFPTLDIEGETLRNQKIISQSETVILSSYDALRDFKSIASTDYVDRGTVLQFVSQPHCGEASSTSSQEVLRKKYGFQGDYFFLPNQFWAHKNHMIVLQALKLLKESGTEVLVLCTGNIKDLRTRDTTYIDGIFNFIISNDLQNQIKILGQIDYDDVLAMMRYSLAVINPSRFEGWSSSVEEAKSMGKRVILSRIDVHLEQAPDNGLYFDPDDVVALSKILADVWANPFDEANRVLSEQKALEQLEKRTTEFGEAYLNTLKEVARRSKLFRMIP